MLGRRTIRSSNLNNSFPSSYLTGGCSIRFFPERLTSVYRSAGGMRRGYMGHLTRIANTVVHNLEKGPVHAQIGSLIAGWCAVMSTAVNKII